MQRAALAILTQGGKILLGRRSAHERVCPHLWDLVGGHIEAGEEPAQALVREVREELGVTVDEFDEFHTMTELKAERGGPCIFHVYLVRHWQGNIAMLGDEHDELRWFAVDEACALPDLAHPDYAALFRKMAKSV